MLERNGWNVLDTADGEEALALSRDHPGRIDLLMTDVVLPAMQGAEVADGVRSARPGVVVVYMSGYARDAFAERGSRPSAFLEKPFDEAQLLSVLQRHLPG